MNAELFSTWRSRSRLIILTEIIINLGLRFFLNLILDTGPPTVFILFVLSHGGENGVIYTDHAPNMADQFTTYDVWDALGGNPLLQDALKINIFGVRM